MYQSKKEKREWKQIWGNVGITESQRLDKVLVILNEQYHPISTNQLYKLIFKNADGLSLESSLNRNIVQLKDDDLISVVESGGGPMQPLIRVVSLTGEGIKLCRSRFAIFRNHPYNYFNFKKKFEYVFTKYVPIIISLIALTVSIIALIVNIHKK